MSTTEVAPFNYSTDLSLRSIQEINATIDQFSYNVLKITPPNGGYTVYIQRPEQESNGNARAQIWRVSIYILELVIAYNDSTGTISLEAYVNVPIIASDTPESSAAALESNSVALPSFLPIASLPLVTLLVMKFHSSQFKCKKTLESNPGQEEI
ncbi:hypothetical protein PNOK_0121000 [Pyrrhoderma noxium]|uniref:Uncharacterized protein n=1 Tax=Pyrrhoderma noxium TaxID=2282107 RepID=A0A286UX85_9AGAM|nr:hypothetical protein PNOK_0121000 [Pyrrhoderma noxium]